jgi:uncharacterized OB-fold protein
MVNDEGDPVKEQSTGWLAAGLVVEADRNAPPGAPIRLAAAGCDSCGRSSFPPACSCTWCGAATSNEVPLGAATSVTSTAVLHPTPGAVVEVPYVVALARFDSANLDVLGRVLGVSGPSELPSGTALHPVAERLPDGRLHFAYAIGTP